MRVAMATPPAAMGAMTRPSLDARPGHGREQNHKRERHGNARDIEEVANGVVRRRIGPLLLKSVSDEHHASHSVPSPKLALALRGVNVPWLSIVGTVSYRIPFPGV